MCRGNNANPSPFPTVILSGAKDLGGRDAPTPRSFAPLRMTVGKVRAKAPGYPRAKNLADNLPTKLRIDAVRRIEQLADAAGVTL